MWDRACINLWRQAKLLWASFTGCVKYTPVLWRPFTPNSPCFHACARFAHLRRCYDCAQSHRCRCLAFRPFLCPEIVWIPSELIYQSGRPQQKIFNVIWHGRTGQLDLHYHDAFQNVLARRHTRALFPTFCLHAFWNRCPADLGHACQHGFDVRQSHGFSYCRKISSAPIPTRLQKMLYGFSHETSYICKSKTWAALGDRPTFQRSLYPIGWKFSR